MAYSSGILSEWRRFLALTSLERWSFCWALVMIPITVVALRVLGLRRWQKCLIKPVPQAELSQSHPQIEKAGRIARGVAIASRRGFLGANCLERSLVICWLLGREGIPGEMHIGVRLDRGKLAAHAWVTSRGHLLTDREEDLRHFVAFSEPIGPTPEAS